MPYRFKPHRVESALKRLLVAAGAIAVLFGAAACYQSHRAASPLEGIIEPPFPLPAETKIVERGPALGGGQVSL